MSMNPCVYPHCWTHNVPNIDFRYQLHPELIPTTPKTGYLPRHILHKAIPILHTAAPYRIPSVTPTYDHYQSLWDDLHSEKQVAISAVKTPEKKFQAVLDVQQFAPDEVTVKIADDHIVVEGTHDEKKDDHGWIKRTFCRRYKIPEDCDIEKIESKISSDGIMIISIPSKEESVTAEGERIIPIKKVAVPAILLQKSKQIESK